MGLEIQVQILQPDYTQNADERMVQVLLEAAYADTAGFVEIVAGHYEGDKLAIDRTRWFEVPSQFAQITEFCEAHTDSDLYWTPSAYRSKERHVDTATVARVVWVDADTCHPSKFRATPSFVVQTSPKRYQCYWLLDRDEPAAKVSELVHRIAVAHKDDGCDASSWPVNKLMRVPGSTHTKTAKHHAVKTTDMTGEVFTFDELNALYADIEVPDVIQVEDAEMGQLPTKAEVASQIPVQLIDTFTGGNFIPEKRSEARWQFETELFRFGFPREFVYAAVVAAAGGRLEKFTSQGRSKDLWREICKAHAAVGDGVAEANPHVIAVPEVSFLSDAERRWVEENPTFISEYVEWVHSRSPQAAETYQRSLAIMVLSCVYGNWAYVLPQHGRMYLNQWFIVVGDTTATRKSTSRNLAMSIVKKWQTRAGTTIDIGSDVTGESLITKLAERDGQVSLFHRDEFQGFLRELYTKNYLSGLIETMTLLYDGFVPKVLRMTKGSGNDKDATTVFNMLMLGITEEVAKSLTTKNFASGFLPRFSWSVADSPEWKPEHEYVGQRDEDTEVDLGGDLVAAKFISQFELARRAWNSTKPKQIKFEADAWERWNEWKIESKRFIRGLPNESIMDPGRDRMSYTILKSASLLALHDRSKTVTLDHLLPALEQAEWWFKDMMRMANMIASSDFEAKADRIESLIAANGGTLARSKVYASAEFKSMRIGEVDEHIRSLMAQGRVSSGTEKGRAVLKVAQIDE